MNRLPSFVVAPLLLCTAGELFGQDLLREHLNGFGTRVAGIRDVDGDAVGDYALSLSDSGGDHVQMRSGSSGATLFTIDGTQPLAWEFGRALADAGDVDSDGVTDLLIGADDYADPAQTLVWPGAVYVHSGRDGSLLWATYGSADNDSLGFAVSGLDDVDVDGFADLLASAIQSPSSNGGGYVRCYSGKTGAPLYQVDGTTVGDQFCGVSVLSDHDHDGIRDFAVSANSYTRICSGASGSTLATIPCPTSRTFLAQCEVDDLDGDGEPEIAIGEEDPVSGRDGEVRVVSIPNQTQLRLHSGAEPAGRFGSRMTSVADADGDGVRDYLIGAPGLFNGTLGSASLYSGRTDEHLYLFVDPESYYLMAESVADAGDLDGDGRSELLIGSPYHDSLAPQPGAALVFRGNDLWLDADLKFPVAGSVDTLATHGAPPGNPVALFMVDVDGTPTFQLLALGAADAAEAFRTSGTVPSGLTGMTLTFRSYAIGGAGSVAVSADETIYFQ